ncbi:MAG: hypothetical protein U1F11_06655 [Steroidobacteraceae bacterium]
MSEEFERKTREVLEESLGRLDGRVRSRLTQARHRALAELEARERSPLARWLGVRALVPAGALAAAALIAVTFWTQRPAGGDAGTALEDVEILADAEGLDLTQDADPEFYEWALGQGESGEAAPEALGS